MRVAAITWLACCVAPIALAGPHTVPAAYTNAANAHQIPPVMLYALSLTESATTLSVGRRPWPWTLNIAGQGERYASRQAACQALTSALVRTRIVDVGISQINVRWQPDLFGDGGRFADPCAALNPYDNLDAAATLLRRCHHQTGGNWIQAAGCYHRPAGGAPAARYRAAFSRELNRLRDGTLQIATGATPVVPAPVSVVRASHDSRPQRVVASTRHVTWINPTTDDKDDHALD